MIKLICPQVMVVPVVVVPVVELQMDNGGERGTGTAGQGFDGARSGNHWYPGGGGGASEKVTGVTVRVVVIQE